MKTTYQSDFNLLHQYLLGDESAGEKLYLNTIPIVRKYIYNRTKGSALSFEDIDEIISETLRKSIEILDRYSGDSAFSTFVIGIAKNEILKAYKKHPKQAKVLSIDKIITEDSVGGELSVIELFQPGKSPLQIVIEKEQFEALREAYDTLNPDYKQIIMMRLFNKVPVKQVAELTGKSEDAIDSLYRRAMKKYREKYIEIYSGPTDIDKTVDIHIRGGIDL